MEDHQIIDLYWTRSEQAITETGTKYGRYCYQIAFNILANEEDAEECVNDTFLKIWNVVPPQRPSVLQIFLARITRHTALDTLRKKNAKKRIRSEATQCIDELDKELQSKYSVEQEVLANENALRIKQFLMTLPERDRRIFLCRYWYFDDIKTIAKHLCINVNTVKTVLARTKKKLTVYLSKE